MSVGFSLANANHQRRLERVERVLREIESAIEAGDPFAIRPSGLEDWEATVGAWREYAATTTDEATARHVLMLRWCQEVRDLQDQALAELKRRQVEREYRERECVHGKQPGECEIGSCPNEIRAVGGRISFAGRTIGQSPGCRWSVNLSALTGP